MHDGHLQRLREQSQNSLTRFAGTFTASLNQWSLRTATELRTIQLATTNERRNQENEHTRFLLRFEESVNFCVAKTERRFEEIGNAYVAQIERARIRFVQSMFWASLLLLASATTAAIVVRLIIMTR